MLHTCTGGEALNPFCQKVLLLISKQPFTQVLPASQQDHQSTYTTREEECRDQA